MVATVLSSESELLENLTFSKDPVAFARANVINVLNFQPIGDSTSRASGVTALAQLDTAKGGYFDISRRGWTGNECLMRGLSRQPPGVWVDPLLHAYWIPYVPIGTQGTGLAGVPWCDVPKVAPPRRFVFTGGMNGCSLVVTDSPALANHYRIYHDSAHAPATFAGVGVHLRLDYNNQHNSPFTYGHATPNPNDIASSCNFLYHDTRIGRWVIVSQPQIITNGRTQPPTVVLNGAIPVFSSALP